MPKPTSIRLGDQRAPNTDYDFFKMLHARGRRAACRFFDSHFDDIGARGTVSSLRGLMLSGLKS